MKNKKVIGILLLMAFVLLLPATNVEAAKLKLNRKKLTLCEGDSYALKTKGVKGVYCWSSNAPEVASVDGTGIVYAENEGKAVITVKVKKWKKKCEVTVINKEPNQADPNVTPEPEKEFQDEPLHVNKTGQKLYVTAKGENENRDGVSNVAQFIDAEGNYTYAYEDGDKIQVVKTKDGTETGTSIVLQKTHPLFGNVAADAQGNYYVVTGEKNETSDVTKETVFVSKYDKDGNLIATVGDDGSSSLAYYYDSSFRTKSPFEAGNCDVAVNGEILTVHYARKMYSEHQSDSVFTIDTQTMSKVALGPVYQSHCFAERVIPYKNGFVYAGEGDAYNRAFSITYANPGETEVKMNDLFHFWIEEGESSNMYVVNNNFAHMGGLAQAEENKVVFMGTSVKALDAAAKEQTEQIFVQIFQPGSELETPDAFVAGQMRTGNSGLDGMDYVTDYGVQWLTDYDKNIQIKHAQIVSDGKGRIVILFEKYNDYSYLGIYCIELDASGEIKKPERCISENLLLNPCTMPVYAQGKICWTANKYNEEENTLYICNLD